ncbi:hypothetical protein ACLESD_35655 [Pyxidicoccus sp. 3LFB2]
MGRSWMAVLLVAVGCDGIDLDQLVKQHPPLSRFAEEPSGVNCPHGGHVVRTGLDRDDDGTLGDAEVMTTEYVCATTLPGMLVRTQWLAPGVQCPRGGQRFRAGHDLNGNNELEDSEIAREVLGCTEPEAIVTRVRALPQGQGSCEAGSVAVEAGPDLDRSGQLEDGERRTQLLSCEDPAAIRLRQADAPISPTCLTGGTRVDVGTDADGDGTFEDEEVTASMRVCRSLQTFDGDYTVRDAADLAALQGISRIRGSLAFVGAPVTEVDLPSLMTVEGAILFRDNPELKGVQLRGLRFVERDLLVSGNPLLKTLAVGSPEVGPLWLGSHLEVDRNAQLTTLAGLRALVPGRGITVSDNALLEVAGSFDFLYELRGDVVLRDNPRLQALPFTSLERVGGSLVITNNDALVSLAGPPLTSISGDFILADNDALTDVSHPRQLTFIGGRLDIRANAALVFLEGMHGLVHAGAISITGNPLLNHGGEFYALQTLTEGLHLGDNAELTRPGVFGGLRHTRRITLIGNPRMGTLDGLHNVTSADVLELRNNPALTDLDGLGGLRELDELRVSFNEGLTRVELSGLVRVRNAFTITENLRLPTCQATALATRTFAGEAVITRNDSTASCD